LGHQAVIEIKASGQHQSIAEGELAHQPKGEIADVARKCGAHPMHGRSDGRVLPRSSWASSRRLSFITQLSLMRAIFTQTNPQASLWAQA
jgi:hypothetical protein